MALKRITAPDGYPVTLEEVKANLRIDHTDDDEVLNRLIAEVTDELDGKGGMLQKALKPQVWELTYDAFPCNNAVIEIPLPPLISVDSIKYDDVDGNEQTVDPDTYIVDSVSIPGYAVLLEGYNWPTPISAINSVRVRFTAGYPDEAAETGDSDGVQSTVPEAIKSIIHMVIHDRYENRGLIKPDDLERLVFRHRWPG